MLLFFVELGDSEANFLIFQGIMATQQKQRLGYHSRAGLEQGTSRFSTLRINHFAARGIETSFFLFSSGTSVDRFSQEL
jgi:hypothetical protein